MSNTNATVVFKWSINKNTFEKRFVYPTNVFAQRLTSLEMRKHYRMLKRAANSTMNVVDFTITHI